MDKFFISVPLGNESVDYEVVDYAYDDSNRCTFEIFREGVFIASFKPDPNGFLHLCQNPGKLDEATLDTLAARLESYNF